MFENIVLKFGFLLFIFSLCGNCFATVNNSLILWQEYISLRDCVYNNISNVSNLLEMYNKAVKVAYDIFSNDKLLIALSRCEFIMGRAYLFENDKQNAAKHFISGAEYAQKSLEIKDSGMGILMYAENISQNCLLQPMTYVIKYGSKIKGLAKEALQKEPSSGAALFLMNAQLIYAPAPFSNYKKGIKELEKILTLENIWLEKDDLFNIFSTLGLGYLELKDKENALAYFNYALELYPGNIHIRKIVEENFSI